MTNQSETTKIDAAQKCCGRVDPLVMRWTSEKPDHPGWYWMRQPHGHLPDEEEIVKVRYYGGKMCIMNWEVPNNAEWAGPIPKPTGA